MILLGVVRIELSENSGYADCVPLLTNRNVDGCILFNVKKTNLKGLNQTHEVESLLTVSFAYRKDAVTLKDMRVVNLANVLLSNPEAFKSSLPSLSLETHFSSQPMECLSFFALLNDENTHGTFLFCSLDCAKVSAASVNSLVRAFLVVLQNAQTGLVDYWNCRRVVAAVPSCVVDSPAFKEFLNAKDGYEELEGVPISSLTPVSETDVSFLVAVDTRGMEANGVLAGWRSEAVSCISSLDLLIPEGVFTSVWQKSGPLDNDSQFQPFKRRKLLLGSEYLFRVRLQSDKVEKIVFLGEFTSNLSLATEQCPRFTSFSFYTHDLSCSSKGEDSVPGNKNSISLGMVTLPSAH